MPCGHANAVTKRYLIQVYFGAKLVLTSKIYSYFYLHELLQMKIPKLLHYVVLK